jgi:hypothetical protein
MLIPGRLGENKGEEIRGRSKSKLTRPNRASATATSLWGRHGANKGGEAEEEDDSDDYYISIAMPVSASATPYLKQGNK